MTDPKTISDHYIATWNSPADQRRAALERAWTPDASYVDPLMSGQGYDGICTMIDSALANFPQHKFELRGTADGFSRFVRFSWVLRDSFGAAAARGTDLVRLDADGRIAQVVGFLDGPVD
jgi:hypothetical protein